MSINNNSFSTGTNIQFGSSDLGDFWLQAQSCAIPGMTFTGPEIDGRNGARVHLQADTITYTELMIDVLIDREWKVYDLIYEKMLNGLNVEKGTFASVPFDLWLDIKTGKGQHVKKFWFYNARISDVSEMNLAVTDEGDEINAMTITFVFDYMDYDNTFRKAEQK